MVPRSGRNSLIKIHDDVVVPVPVSEVVFKLQEISQVDRIKEGS